MFKVVTAIIFGVACLALTAESALAQQCLTKKTVEECARCLRAAGVAGQTGGTYFCTQNM